MYIAYIAYLHSNVRFESVMLSLRRSLKAMTLLAVR